MQKILYLSFYFEPDLCAGSFRNTPLVKELAKQVQGRAVVDLITTMPNRYSTFLPEAPQYEECDNLQIRRIAIPAHQSRMVDQVRSFRTYYNQVKKYVKDQHYDLVVASSSRLFTAYLGYTIAEKLKATLYLDIRDIFYETLDDVLAPGLVKSLSLPIIKLIEKRTFRYASHINLISEGFRSYFESYEGVQYSYFPNGIDDIFIQTNTQEHHDTDSITQATEMVKRERTLRTIVYAGNMGEGQGLHKIIPVAAQQLDPDYHFLVIGDGGAKQKLINELDRLNVSNVTIQDPVKREELIRIYQSADYLFAHLNDYKAFDRALPSKLFELATFSKPLIAGVGGYANKFISENIDNKILFKPCDVDSLVSQLRNYKYTRSKRQDFIDKFKRITINKKMAFSILKYL